MGWSKGKTKTPRLLESGTFVERLTESAEQPMAKNAANACGGFVFQQVETPATARLPNERAFARNFLTVVNRRFHQLAPSVRLFDGQ